MSQAGNGLEFAAVLRDACWRARLTWPSSETRYVGRFSSEAEADQWIKAHRWLQNLRTTAPHARKLAPPPRQ